MKRILILFNFVIFLHLVLCHIRNDDIEKNIQRCMGSCVMPKAQVYAPVCASDGNTYSSRHLVMCRDACSTQYGHGLQVVYEGPCSYAYNHQNPSIHG
ncbi:hypothetical protein WA026_023260 [Henosepilachna vigintioctopunctata]|uniref:Kazal-like domain-containing protein n=1 Tax=Henosepilachna vigintioctopunctata TaxID=420089 RepID=A0AAW1V411_9CUCU